MDTRPPFVFLSGAFGYQIFLLNVIDCCFRAATVYLIRILLQFLSPERSCTFFLDFFFNGSCAMFANHSCPVALHHEPLIANHLLHKM